MKILSPGTAVPPFRRAIVIGCPGGGKSTFSRALRDRTGLPLFHLDAIYWKADRTHLDKETFRARLGELLVKDTWIIDGNYGSTMEERISACDAVFFLDYSTEVCLSGIRARKGQRRSDMPWIEEGEDPEFLYFVKQFTTESRPKILALLEKYPDKPVMHFTSREEAEKYLETIG